MGPEGKPLIGRALGDFIVRDQIGEGGFGVVYRAEQPMLGREAVVKVSAQASSPEFVDRFLKEARLASKLDHPYAAHIYAFGSESDGTLWTAMELVRGTPLDQLIKHQGPLRLERFVPFFDKLCEVVHTAHEQGIIHRDLKPANVMVLSRAGRLLPKLLDLGIAKGGAEEGRAEKQLGSPAYMAPEQWMDARKADARTDVYALGILAFEVLTGKLPFTATTVTGYAKAHAKSAVPPLENDLPVELNAVIAKAMAKKSADRYASALDLAAAMREAAAVEPQQVKLPELDPFLREELLGNAPQPLAEAVAALDGVRNVHQAQAALFGIVRVVARMLGNLALACWRRTRETSEVEPPAELTELMRELRRGLADAQWLDLARVIVKRAVDAKETLALPELADLFQPVADEAAALLASKAWFDTHVAATEAQMLAQLGEAMPKLDKLLRALAWLSAYALVVPRGMFGESWMGVRRMHRAVTPVRGGSEREGELVLLDADGTVALSLAPFFQIAAPAPGHAAELFVLDGANRDGARMVSLPTGFERTDEALWKWVKTNTGLDADEREQASDQKPPYRGLSTFKVEDAGQFVGREQETEAFTNRLRITPLLVVVGASGAGKSSFVQAGVVPALGDNWETIIVRPGGSPISTLTATLGASPLAPDMLEDIDGEGLGRVLRAWTEREKKSVLIYIDQFEELFTLCHDVAERERYVQMLVRAARLADAPIRVVLTVRDDFLLRCQQVEALRERLVHGLQLLATPTSSDLERILIEPARRAGYQFEDPALPTEMVGAVAEMSAALPLLSFTAAQMWELRDRHVHRLTRKAYETLGGVGGALAQHAEKVFAAMSPEEQRLTRVAFRNLVTADGTRAVLTRAELLEVVGEPAVAEGVLEKLITARLLTASEGVGGVDRVEVVHEALLSAWPRLLDWRREDAEGARLRDQLRAAARQWDERGRPRGLLWRDEALTEYQLWRVRYGGALLAVEAEFGDASAREALRGRRLRNAAIGVILAILVVGMVVALVLYRQAEGQRKKATVNEKRAVSNETRANSLVTQSYITQGQRASVAGDASRALVYLAAAREGGASGPLVDIPIAEARRGFLTEKAVFRGHTGKVTYLAILDEKSFATAGADNIVQVWDLANPAAPRATLTGAKLVTNLSASTDGRWLVVASADGRVALYDAAATGAAKPTHEWKLPAGNIFTARITADAKKVVAITENQDVGVFDVASGDTISTFHGEGDGGGFGDVSADGRYVSLGSYDTQARIWDTQTKQLVKRFGPAEGTVWDATLSPDGKLLATASWDNKGRLWDVKTGALVATLVGHSAPVDFVVWSDDGERVATGARDGVVRLWDRKGALTATLHGSGNVHRMGWSHDGKRLAVACGDLIIVFDTDVGMPLFSRQAGGKGAYAAYLLPHGEVISAEADGTARMSIPTPNVAFSHAHQAATVHANACAHDRVITVGEDHTARVFTVAGAEKWHGENIADAICGTASDVVYAIVSDSKASKLVRYTGDSDRAVDIPLSAGAQLPDEPVLGLSPDETTLSIVDKKHHAILVDTKLGTVTDGGTATFERSYEPKLYWANDGSVFAIMSDSGAVVYDGATGKVRFEVKQDGGIIRRILIDVAHDSFYVTTMEPDVRRYSLATGTETMRYKSAGFPWSMLVLGDSLYVGFDNGVVEEYDVATGRELRNLGTFGADVFTLGDPGKGLLWVGAANQTLSLVALDSRAVLFRSQLPADPMFLVAHGDDAMIAGPNGIAAFTHVDARPVDPARLAIEVKCRASEALRDGTLEPREPDLSACTQLATLKD